MLETQRPSSRVWRKVIAVAAREYLSTVRTKAFILTLVVMPLLFLSALAVPLIADGVARSELKRVAVVDPTGALLPALRARLEANAAEADRPSELDPLMGSARPNLELVEAAPRANQDRASHWLELSDRVRAGELYAFLVVGPELLTPGGGELRFHGHGSAYSGTRRWLTQATNDAVTELRLRRADIDPRRVRQLSKPVRIRSESLYERSNGETRLTRKPDPVKGTAVPLVLGLLLLMSVMMGASPLMHSVLEEKMHRIAEILVSSLPPFQLMLGKLVGALWVAYTMLFVYWVVLHGLSLQLGFGSLVTARSILVILLAGGAAVLTYGSVFLAVGSACNDLREAQTLMLPVMVLITAPLLFLQLILTDPNSAAAAWLTSLPFLSPILMALRLLLVPAPPLPHVLLSALVTGATAWACVAAAARVFRIGMLTHGQIPSYRTLWRWVRHG